MSTKEKCSNYYGVLVFIILVAFFSMSSVKAVGVETIAKDSIVANTQSLLRLDEEMLKKIEVEAGIEAQRILTAAKSDAMRITSNASSIKIDNALVVNAIMQDPAIVHSYSGMYTATDIVYKKLSSSILGQTKLSYTSKFTFQSCLRGFTSNGNIPPSINLFSFKPDFTKVVKKSSERVNGIIESANKEATGILDNAVSQAQVSIKGRLSTVIKELYTVAALTQRESGNQPLLGRVAVVNVVYNRVNSPRFANNAIDVICSPGQFAPAKTLSQVKYIAPDTWQALKMHFEGVDAAKGAFYFYNPRYSTAKNKAWFETLKTTVIIGGHTYKM